MINKTKTTKNPSLRFPEFSEEWEEVNIQNAGVQIVDGDRGENYPNGNDFSDKGFCLFLNAKNVTSTGFSFLECSFINSAKDRQLRKGKLVRSDLVLTTRGTVGNVAYYDQSIGYEHIRVNSGMVLLRTFQSKILPNYLYKFTNSIQFSNQLIRLSFGSAQPQLTVSGIAKLKLAIPSKSEQQKIASFLTSVDDWIENLKKQKEAQEKYKKGMMQKIFSQEIRFKDDNGIDYPKWEEKRLGEVAEIVGGGTPDTKSMESWNGEINWFTPTEIKQKYVYDSLRKISNKGLKNSSARLLPEGSLLLTTRATVGDIAIARIECSTNQGFQSLIVNKENSNMFFYYWILNNKKEFVRKANGSTFVEISGKEVRKISCKRPVLKEQRKIADFLSSIDDLIILTKQRITLAEEWKKGVMQRVFV